MAAACGTNLDAAREAARRYRTGRAPSQHNPGLSPKSLENIHVMMHKAQGDAGAWGYLLSKPGHAGRSATIPSASETHVASGHSQWHAAIGVRWGPSEEREL